MKPLLSIAAIGLAAALAGCDRPAEPPKQTRGPAPNMTPSSAPSSAMPSSPAHPSSSPSMPPATSSNENASGGNPFGAAAGDQGSMSPPKPAPDKGAPNPQPPKDKP